MYHLGRASKVFLNMASLKIKTISKQSAPISTIFFDLDNTLIPTRKGDTKACNKVNYLLCNWTKKKLILLNIKKL